MSRAGGIIAVRCMARPRRCESVAELVAAAMGAMAPDLSKRAKAAHLARRVVAELAAEMNGRDQFDIALRRARLLFDHDLAFQIALHPGLDLVAEFMRERCSRYMARDCAQISPEEHRAEGEAIADLIASRLAERFRR